jgi:hypothetical protein
VGKREHNDATVVEELKSLLIPFPCI